MFSAALVELAKSISVHSCSLPTSSSDCLPCSFFFHCALYYLFAETEHIEAWPNHLSFRFLTKISSPCTPMTSFYGHKTENDVVLTSMRRDDVASTFIRRHFGTKCPLGTIFSAETGSSCEPPLLFCGPCTQGSDK